MRIKINLSAFSKDVERLKNVWSQVGGDSKKLQITTEFASIEAYEDDADGVLIAAAAEELKATYLTPLQQSRFVEWSDTDRDKADLLELSVGDGKQVLDRQSVVGGGPCPDCGITRRMAPGVQGLKFGKRSLKQVDLNGDLDFVLVSQRLMQALQAIGVDCFTPIENNESFFWINAPVQFGLPADGTQWNAPCPSCGICTGTTQDHPILGMLLYHRADWHGDPIVGERQTSATLFVSQAVREILQDKKWKVSDELSFRPVTWVD